MLSAIIKCRRISVNKWTVSSPRTSVASDLLTAVAPRTHWRQTDRQVSCSGGPRSRSTLWCHQCDRVSQNGVGSPTADARRPALSSVRPSCSLHEFQPLVVPDVLTAVHALPDKGQLTTRYPHACFKTTSTSQHHSLSSSTTAVFIHAQFWRRSSQRTSRRW